MADLDGVGMEEELVLLLAVGLQIVAHLDG
jgi:hypothetical protein